MPASAAVTSATAVGSTGPWYGQPSAVETYPRTHIPAASASATTER